MNASIPRTGGGPATGVLGKVFTLLDTLAAAGGELTLAELTRRTGYPKATVHRLAADLAAWGALERRAEGLRLGTKLFELGQLVPQPRVLRTAALPYMEDLYEATHETVHLAVLDGHQVVYLEKIAGHRASPTPTRVGGRMPAVFTALGKAMLAYLPPDQLDGVLQAGARPRTRTSIISRSVLTAQLEQIREHGAAYDREESMPGLVCVAAPVFGPHQQVVAALSVAGPKNRFSPERSGAAVQTAARSLSRALSASTTGE